MFIHTKFYMFGALPQHVMQYLFVTTKPKETVYIPCFRGADNVDTVWANNMADQFLSAMQHHIESQMTGFVYVN